MTPILTWSLGGLEEIVAERGWTVDHPIVWRWLERHGPEVHRRLRGEAKNRRIVERFELCVFIADLVREEVAQLASNLAFCQ